MQISNTSTFSEVIMIGVRVAGGMATKIVCTLIISLSFSSQLFAQTEDIRRIIDNQYNYIEKLYKYFHAHPELSMEEENTSGRLAKELRQLGYLVTEKVGGYGIVAVLENGDGPVVMVRADMDALPIKEETGVSFASNQLVTMSDGQSTHLMHACGHDIHMSVLVGTAKIFKNLQDKWQGTLVLIGQPSEENFTGAGAMIEDGLFERFPLPDYILGLHVNSAQSAGEVGYSPGYAYANVDMGRIVVKGRGGHGAYPDLTIDPVVLASQLVMSLQTIITREISALDPANITIGSIHGGTSANIIPNEVELRLVLRSLNNDVHEKLIKRINEKCEGIGYAAGLPKEDWPKLILNDATHVSSVYNTPELGEKLKKSFSKAVGEENVYTIPPLMYGEDFGEYGSAKPEIPAFLFSLGSVKPEDLVALEKGLIDDLPSTHSSKYLPDFEPTIKTGILTMSSAVMDLFLSENY